MKYVSIFSRFFDLLFPPTRDEAIVRSLSSDDLSALATITPIPHGVALMRFRDARVRALVHRAKYAEDPHAIFLLASVLHAQLSFEIEPWLLVPIPLSPSRLLERGFNQSERILREAVKGTSHSVAPHLLTRVRDTTPQTHLSRIERLTNLSGACVVPHAERDAVRGADLVLVDDVSTTGATFTEARRALLAAGARSVRVIALAH